MVARSRPRLVASIFPFAVIAVGVPRSDALSLRRQCRLACKEAIAACVASGGKRRACRRETLRLCHAEGVTACGGTASTTTTTLASIGAPVNACDPDSATDMRGQMGVTVRFGGALGFRYEPACLRVSPGTEVTFGGEFDEHPLVGGQVSGSTKAPDPSSPLGGPTSNGTSKTVMLQAAGTFPFYCDVHAFLGMKGAVFVAP
jgi:plastocyanin